MKDDRASMLSVVVWRKQRPLWFDDFEKEAQRAVDQLLSGATNYEKMRPFDINFPADALEDWLLSNSADFVSRVDVALTQIITSKWGRRTRFQKDKIFWKNLCQLIIVKHVRPLLPCTFLLLREKQRAGKDYLRFFFHKTGGFFAILEEFEMALS